MSAKDTGIKIYREPGGRKQRRRDRLPVAIVSSLAAAGLGMAWWNAFLSVFSFDLDIRWLYGGLLILSVCVSLLTFCVGKWTAGPVFLAAGIFLWREWEAVEALFLTGGQADRGITSAAAAVLTLPLLVLWVFVFLTGKGKGVSGVAAAVPFVAGALVGTLPSGQSSWLLLFAGMMYGVLCSFGRKGAQRADFTTAGPINTHIRTAVLFLAAAGGFAILMWISAFTGRYLDAGREMPGSVYQTVRSRIHTDLIGGIEDLVSGLSENQEEEEQSGPEEEAAGQETEETTQQEAALLSGEDEQRAEIFGDDPSASEGSMDHLREIGSYSPDPGAHSSIVVVHAKPEGTVYVPERTGIRYTGGTWERGEGPVPVRKEGEELFGQYLEYPSGLDRLEELCRDWDKSSPEAVGRGIDEAFAAMAVYDTVPGPTPDGKDFAEYFLFENHKGFCVHFATTAALLYRMCGYPSVYVEGYAVPASAFRQQADGSYRAFIDGTMGHAWCKVYDGKWTDKEHTLPAEGGTAEELPQAEARQENETEAAGGLPWGVKAAVTAALVSLAVGAVLLQAAARRRKMLAQIRYTAEGNGIPAMYDLILRMADAAERAVKGPAKGPGIKRPKVSADQLNVDRLEALKEEYPQISPEEWDWFYQQVMEALFYRPDGGEEAWKHAYRMCRAFSEAAWTKMGAWKRLVCRYVYGMRPLPAAEEAEENRKRKKENSR